jgi:hypothetical protein
MLQPFLIIGVGGSGGKTIRALRHALELRLEDMQWTEGMPQAWQFLHIDSPVHQDGTEFPAPMLEKQNYFGLAQPAGTYKMAFQGVLEDIDPKNIPEIERYLPSDSQVAVNVAHGAGQFRAVGRTLVLSRMDDVKKKIAQFSSQMTSGGSIGQLDTLGRKLGATPQVGDPTPVVMIISSIAGGSGAGQYMDVAEAVKDANSNANWIHGIYSILYAPDVFASVGDTNLIAPNALFAMSESMAGMWSNNLSASSEALYQKFGIQIPNLGEDPKIHFGPKFNYIIGRKNSKVSFANQPDIYKAVAASLTTWLTEERVQSGLQAYTEANYQANLGATGLPDKSMLAVPNQDTPPFASLGFGRVTLGRDRFADYAADRLARTSIEKLLDGHKDYLNQNSNNESDQIQQKVALVFPEFKNDLGLGSSGDGTPDVVKAMRPQQRVALLATLREQLLSRAAQGVNQKGSMPPNVWNEQFLQAYNQIALPDHEFARKDRELRARSLQEWTSQQKRRTLVSISRFSSRNGIKVAIELLKKLENDIQSQVIMINDLQSKAALNGSKVKSQVPLILQGAQSSQAIPYDHPIIAKTIQFLADSFAWYLHSESLAEISKLLLDYQDNFVVKLRNQLNSMYTTLYNAISPSNQSEIVQNAFKDWPKPNDEHVPPKYNSAPNEYMLVELEKFPVEYKSLIEESVPQAQRNDSVSAVLDELIMGSLLLDDLEDKRSWEFISEEVSWIPQLPGARLATQMPQPARFTISADPAEYLARSKWWMRRKGKAFQNYLGETLANYMDESKASQEIVFERKKQFREQILAAFRASEPLVELNPSLLSQVHSASIEDRQIVVSPIPFAVGSDLYREIKGMLDSVWDDKNSDSWFNQNSLASYIDFFSIQKPYQPMVMSSIFGPIGEAWLKAQNDPLKRQAFFKWRRSRTLWDSVPAAPEIKSAMIRGWYVARVLSQMKVEVDNKAQPKIEIWTDEGFKYSSFPYPLATKDPAEFKDYVGAILYSLGIALGLCNSNGTLEPIISYQRLITLGEVKNSTQSEFIQWLQKGTLRFDEQPRPDVTLAGPTGSGSSEIAARKEAVIAALTAYLKKFTAEIESLDPRNDVEKLNLTWEIRREIRDAIEALIGATDKVSIDEDKL